jgi:hypothetical protein
MFAAIRRGHIALMMFAVLAAGAALPVHAAESPYVFQIPLPGLLADPTGGDGDADTGGGETPPEPVSGLTLSNPEFPLTNVNEASIAYAVLANNTAETVTLNAPDASTVSNPFDTTFRFYAPGTTCSTSLAPGESCNIGARFTPYNAGRSYAALTVFTSLGARQVHLSALSVTGFSSFSTDTIDFGATPVGVPVNRVVTLTNTGEGRLGLVEIKAQNRTDYGPTPDFAQTNNCGTNLDPGASCTISITFTPTAAGVYDQYGAEVLVDHRGSGLARIYLGGTGL